MVYAVAVSYTALDASRIVETLERLERRISERFPNASLAGVAQELLGVARTASGEAINLERPIWPIRLFSSGLIAGLLVLIAVTLFNIKWPSQFAEATQLVPLLESAVNDMIFVALAVFFLAGWENRVKRSRALQAVHRLRSLAHVVDMHQLTKDPEHLLSNLPSTPSSPERTMSRFELVRYLDYCSELLSLTSKLAALYVQHLPDPQVQAAVNEIVTLTTGLSGKIWQKIVILDTRVPGRTQEGK
jgi:hypothetical protein